MKKFLIIYQPGYGGHFLQYLFGLSAESAPCLTTLLNHDSVQQRLDSYSFKNHQHYLDWTDFHVSFDSSYPADTLLSGYPVKILCCHPKNFSTQRHSDYELYIVDLDWNDFNNFWLVESKIRWGHFPQTEAGECDKEIWIRQTLNPKTINIGCFLNPQQWHTEYERICGQLNVTPVNSAEALYKDWYAVRVEPLLEKFHSLDSATQTLYNQKRLWYEQNQIERKESWNQWAKNYSNIRAPHWPDCLTPPDYYQLPADIQQQLTEIHGLDPCNYVVDIKNF